MTNAKQWNESATQQLVRYEALTQLIEDILAVDDLVQIARRVATRWKYFANVASWRLISDNADGYLVIDGIRGDARLAEVLELSDWDAYHWTRQRPTLIGLDAPAEGGKPPEHLAERGITEIQVLPLFRAARCSAMISVAARYEPFSELDNKFIRLFGRYLADRISYILHHRQAERLLRESEMRYRSLAENSADWIWTMGADGRITYTNDRSLELFGMSREEFYETDSLNLVHPEDKAMLQDVLSTAVKNKCGWHDVLIRRRSMAGRYRAFESNASAILDGEGELVGFQGVDRDVTERKQAAEEREKLAAQNRQLQKSESLSRMAGAIAHHFNNQLTAVMMNLEMVLSQLPRHGEIFEHLSEGMQSVRNAATVSTQMLTYLGQTTVHREPLDLAAVCRRHLPVIQAVLPTDVVLELDLPTPGPTVVAFVDHLQQILTNLVTNAWEASARGQGKIRLSVKTVYAEDVPAENRFPVGWRPQDSGYACLEVADAGSGIATHDIEKVFDPFFSTKFTGRGLGLPVVLGIVRSQHGAITVESKSGRGSCFRVFLPTSAAEVSREPILVAKPSKPAFSGRLLVVEDEPLVRKVVTLAFQRLGYTVLTAQDGVEAVEVFQTQPDKISCVLCDLSMPRMNGWATLAALRKLAPGIPVILASGYSEAQALEGEHSELPQAFLSKPYDLEILKATLARVLGEG